MKGSHPDAYLGNSIPGRGKRYKGPEVAAFLTCLKQRGEPNEAGVAWRKGESYDRWGQRDYKGPGYNEPPGPNKDT